MSYGRMTVVLGAEAGLPNALGLKTTGGASLPQTPLNLQGLRKLSPVEVQFVLSRLGGYLREAEQNGIEILFHFAGVDAEKSFQILNDQFQWPITQEAILREEELKSIQKIDAFLFIPLDIHPQRQVETMVRYSMSAPRARHLVFGAIPRWSHSQLLALREAWDWIDVKHIQKIQDYLKDLVRGMQGTAMLESPVVSSSDEVVLEPNILTRSPKMREVLSLIDAVADTDSTVLITGESGTGKELFAQRIHARSHRRHRPLICINCAAIPSELLESELFGHIKGAFTGAVANRAGRFEVAEGGTLFLDEIGELGPNLQAKLLRVLQTRRYEPVGCTKSRQADVRIIAATNRDLEVAVSQGNFREDLFYRLNVIPAHIPSLKDRLEDIPILIEHFVRKFNREKTRRVTGVTRAALRALLANDWNGNIRELENLMERMVILKSSGMIDLMDFPEKYRRKTLSEIEYEDVLASAEGAVLTATTLSIPKGIVEEHFEGNLETKGGDINMKINPGVFTRSTIEQSVEPVATQVAQQAISNPSVASLIPNADVQISIEQALALVGDHMRFPNEGLDFNSVVDQFENILILMALERTGWNRNRAASLLRLNRTTLVEKLKKKQLAAPIRQDGSMLSASV